jgi:hypothetical protein
MILLVYPPPKPLPLLCMEVLQRDGSVLMVFFFFFFYHLGGRSLYVLQRGSFSEWVRAQAFVWNGGSLSS